jgi:predicted HD superfamily hydrolase involved in NAD metabolism
LLSQRIGGRRCGPANASEFLALCSAVRESLPHKRYRHVLGVARTAERLARRYGSSPQSARVAGLIHDIARAWSPEKLLDYAKSHALAIADNERRSPVLLHARVAAHVARERFGVDDPDTLAAIEHHTIAVPNMSDLEKILYIADTIEPSRTFPGRAALEQAAHRSLNEGMLACIEASLEHLKHNGIPAAPATIALYHQLVTQREART